MGMVGRLELGSRDLGAVWRRSDWHATAWTAAAALAGMAAMVLASRVVGEWEMGLMLRDPLAVARAGDDVDFLAVGWLSHLGVMVWGVAAAAGIVGAVLRWADPSKRATARMLGAAGVLSLGLLVDDLFQVHESVLPTLLSIGEKRTMAAWGALGVAWFVVFARPIARSRHLPLVVLAGAFLAASIAVDVTEDLDAMVTIAGWLGGPAVIEDGPKLMGILCWAVFLWRVGIGGLAPAFPPAGGRDGAPHARLPGRRTPRSSVHA